MSSDERVHLEELRQNYLRRLRILEQQAATFGASTPPEVVIEIEDIHTVIQKLDIGLGTFATTLTVRNPVPDFVGREQETSHPTV